MPTPTFPTAAAAPSPVRPSAARRRLMALSGALLGGGWLTCDGAQAQAGVPSLRGRTSDGQAFDLRQLHGSAVLLFAWSTRCPVCMDKWPELRRNLQGWIGRPFAIVALNLDPSPEPWREWLQVMAATTPRSPQLLHLWRGAEGHHDDLGDLPPRSPTLQVLDRSGHSVQQHRGRMPAELWDTVAELVLS